MGIKSYAPALDMEVSMNEVTMKHIDKHIMLAMGVKVKEVQEHFEGGKQLKSAKLEARRKVGWSSKVSRLPPEEAATFEERALAKVVCAPVKSSSSRGTSRKRSVQSLSLPASDVVVPPNGRSNKPCAAPCLKIRPGMLSSRLLSRFSHLCTET